MSHYSHFTTEKRELSRVMKAQGFNDRAIARSLKRSNSSVSREFARNSREDGTYSANYADKQYAERRKNCGRKPILENEQAKNYVIEKLEQRWTPEQIAGRAKLEKQPFRISYPTIYRAIDSGILPKKLKKIMCFKCKHNKCKGEDRRGKIPDTVSIHEHPAGAENRSRYGHWESDTVLGKRGTGCIATHVERKSGYLVAVKIPDRQDKAFTIATIATFAKISEKLKKSFTVDNGKEFASHKELAAGTGMKVFFCDPYSPWQRGTNENTNGLLRQFFPKGSSFDDFSDEQLQAVVELINNRPRKRLGFVLLLSYFLIFCKFCCSWVVNLSIKCLYERIKFIMKIKKLSINKNPYVRSFPYHAFVDIVCNNDLTNSNCIAEFEVLNEKINLWNIHTNKSTYEIRGEKVYIFSKPYVEKNNFKAYRKLKENDEIIVMINKHLFTNAWSNISIFISDINKLQEFPDFEQNAPIASFSRGIGYGFYMHVLDRFYSLFKTRKIIFPYYIKIKTSKSTIVFSFKDKEDWKELTSFRFTYSENNCLGINLNIADNQYYNWIYTNFINLQGNLNDLVRLDWINTPKRNYKFYTVNPMLTFEYVEWNIFNSDEMFRCICDNIDNNKYIEIYLNEKYLENTLYYEKCDFIHENLCYGYDDDNKLIFLVNIRDGKPNLIEVSIDGFMKGFLSNNNNNFVHTLLYNADEAYYRFNKKYMILNLRQYLKGVNCSENFGFCSNTEDKTYGVALYDLLTTEEGTLKLLDDKRMSFLIFEHKKIMRDRINFLYDRKYIEYDDYLRLYSAFQENLNNSELMLMLVLKNKLKPINDIDNKLNNIIKIIKNNEIQCINELITSIEKCVKNED